MKKLISIVLALTFAASLAACAGPYPNLKSNRANLVSISSGMTEAQVVEIMGQPSFKDVMEANGMLRTTYYYFTNELGTRAFSSSIGHLSLTRDDCTPLVFKDGVLVASGRYEKLYY